MVHIIIILHFLCFALGVGFITLNWLVYKRYKTNILKDMLIGEIFFSVLFLIDTIGIYIRKILVQYNIESVFKIVNYLLVAIVMFYLYKIIKKVMDHELYKWINMQIKIIIGLLIMTSVLFLLSYNIKVLQVIPYLCIIYSLQCILGIVCCIKERKEIIQEDNSTIILEEIVPKLHGSDSSIFEPGSFKDLGINQNCIFKNTLEQNDNLIHKEDSNLKCLTNREKEIVEYICMGLSNKEIGEKLFISANTVKNHIYNIYKKVNVKNKVELINLVNKID